MDITYTSHGAYGVDELIRRARRAVGNQTGEFVAGLGRVESATVMRARPTEGAYGRRRAEVEARITLS